MKRKKESTGTCLRNIYIFLSFSLTSPDILSAYRRWKTWNIWPTGYFQRNVPEWNVPAIWKSGMQGSLQSGWRSLYIHDKKQPDHKPSIQTGSWSSGWNLYYISRKAKVISMWAVSLIKGVLLNICIICSMVCIALKVLDWYNPYMDFTGHAAFIPYILYVSVFLYAILQTFSGRHQHTILFSMSSVSDGSKRDI